MPFYRGMSVSPDRRQLALLAVALVALMVVVLLRDEPAQTSRASAVTVMAVGDIACAPGTPATPITCKHPEVAAVITTADPDYVVALGDLQYDVGSREEFLGGGGYDDILGSLKERTLPVLGNHEYFDPAGVAAGYFDYFGRRDPGPVRTDGSPGGYYTRRIGTWRFIALNSECEPDASNRNTARAAGCARGSAQYRWLQSVLKSSSQRCTLVAFHRARWTTGAHLPYEPMAAMWDLMARSGVDVVISGHNHSSEVLRPIGASGTGAPKLNNAGIRSFVAGAGGKDLYAFRAVRAPMRGASQARDSTAFGPLRLTLRARTFDWSFVPISGQRFTNVGTSGRFSARREPCH